MSDDFQKTEIIQETRRNLNAGKVVFSRFELERELGSGGMGVVWLAKDLEVEGRVALKFLPGLVRDPIAERDLRDEVKNARNLVHENIVSVRTLHKDEASIAVEMEYVDGPNLTMLIRDTPNRFLDVDKAGPIVRGLCLAIDHAWQPPRRLVHRDIKPHNMLVDSAGHVKVVDFGIAHTVSETVSRLTGQGPSERVVGTLPYMSPQQLKGEVDHRNDVYSIGATIYHTLTGSPPFRATDPAVLTQQINHDVPMSIAERRRQLANEGRTIAGAQAVPRAWEETIAACLAKDPAQRPASAREIAARLGLVEGAAVSGAPGVSRRLIGLAASLVVAAGAVFWYVSSQSSAPQAASAAPASGKEAAPPSADISAAGPAIAGAAAAVQPPVSAASVAPVPPAPVVVMRESWRLVTTEPVHIVIAHESDGRVEFDGLLNAGDKRSLPVDRPFFVRLKEGKGIAVEIDGDRPLPLSSSAGRWLVTVPASSAEAPTVKEAPLPFEAEVGPLWYAGQLNETEADWLRAALGGAHGEAERALVSRLFAQPLPLTLGQWRARTALKFPPDAATLAATRPNQLVRALDLPLPGGGTMRLLRLEAGTYRRGSPPEELGRRPSDAALGNATVAKPFFIGAFEVTQGEYEAVMKANPSYWRRERNPALPVEQVTWSLINGNGNFIPRLNEELRRLAGGLLIADLPTDEEWEYACRAGTTGAFSNGWNLTRTARENEEALAGIAWYGKTPVVPPKPVGSFQPNPWGLHDMHGNIQEWTKDGYVRGGSWLSPEAAIRSAARAAIARDASQNSQNGLRLVLRFREAPAGK